MAKDKKQIIPKVVMNSTGTLRMKLVNQISSPAFTLYLNLEYRLEQQRKLYDNYTPRKRPDHYNSQTLHYNKLVIDEDLVYQSGAVKYPDYPTKNSLKMARKRCRNVIKELVEASIIRLAKDELVGTDTVYRVNPIYMYKGENFLDAITNWYHDNGQDVPECIVEEAMLEYYPIEAKDGTTYHKWMTLKQIKAYQRKFDEKNQELQAAADMTGMSLEHLLGIG